MDMTERRQVIYAEQALTTRVPAKSTFFYELFYLGHMV